MNPQVDGRSITLVFAKLNKSCSVSFFIKEDRGCYGNPNFFEFLMKFQACSDAVALWDLNGQISEVILQKFFVIWRNGFSI